MPAILASALLHFLGSDQKDFELEIIDESDPDVLNSGWRKVIVPIPDDVEVGDDQWWIPQAGGSITSML